MARAWDELLGGTGSYSADRRMIGDVEAQFAARAPGVQSVPRMMALAARMYVEQAITQAAHAGIRQFLDLGCGPMRRPRPGNPPLRNVHEAAQAARPAEMFTTCYVDRDPEVVATVRAQLDGVPGVAVAEADLADPGTVLGSEEAWAVLDSSRPVCVIMSMVLHFMPAGQAQAVAREYMAAFPAGSRLVITAAHTPSQGLYERIAAAYTAGRIWNHGPEVILAMLDGLEMVGAGVMPAMTLDAAWPETEPEGVVLAGTGRKR